MKLFGSKNLNRALHGDRVAIEILPEKGLFDLWQVIEIIEWKKINFAELGEEITENEEAEAGQDIVPTDQINENLKSLVEKIKSHDLTPTGKVLGNFIKLLL